ncbi:MAG TPA: metallophosphoesterase [Mycobacteriales bacterium]|nr:metallophosphoesterase [Mycobacteriales bacterium]
MTGAVVPRLLRVHDVPLALPGWPPSLDGLRVAVVTDLHAGAPWVGLDRVRLLVRRVLAAEPDLVLLLGDHVADVLLGRPLAPEPLAEALSGLTAAGPVLGVLGNHDWQDDGERVRRALEDAGLPVLEQSAVPVLDGRLWVAGVGDLWTRGASVPAALAGVPEGATTVLLTHNPDVVVDVPDTVALVLAGHTHGGQLTVLGHPLHRISRRSGNRWRRGWYPADRLYVGSGIGTSTLPLRTVVPEVPVLVLRPG